MLSENIKKYRLKLGLTQEELAQKANLPYNTIIKLEGKSRPDPRMETLIKLADGLEVTLDQLVGRNENRTK